MKKMNSITSFVGFFLIYVINNNNNFIVQDCGDTALISTKNNLCGADIYIYLSSMLKSYYNRFYHQCFANPSSPDELDKLWNNINSCMSVHDNSITINKF